MENTDNLWPTHNYYQQVEQLRTAIGKPLYLVEINTTDINAGVKFPNKPLTLLGITDFPRPDPYQQLCPHLLILEDGRGVNLGRIARITLNTAYSPVPGDVLFTNQEFMENVLLAPRSLSHASVAATSRALLAQLFGDVPGKLLAQHTGQEMP